MYNLKKERNQVIQHLMVATDLKKATFTTVQHLLIFQQQSLKVLELRRLVAGLMGKKTFPSLSDRRFFLLISPGSALFVALFVSWCSKCFQLVKCLVCMTGHSNSTTSCCCNSYSIRVSIVMLKSARLSLKTYDWEHMLV